MPNLTPMEPGVMFWAGRDRLEEIAALGVRCGQLGLAGDMELSSAAVDQWGESIERAGFTVVTVFAAYIGESYADIATVQRTVGFVPPETRKAREMRTLEVSDFAAELGVDSIACHIGFVPEDPADPDYEAVAKVVRRVADHAAANSQSFALETGQERAEVLLRFMDHVARPNLRINFDPANMVLYGTGEPIEALRALAPRVVSVHCKDGDWPQGPGQLGTERPLGQGSVGIPRFVSTLREIGFRGPLNVEREAEDQAERLRDIAAAVQWLKTL